ncbi:MAG: formate dehydrogenase accessory sulfurtransferase FdhD [Thermodesulfobacteriota bacterium]|nr:formate dehydrogenase accessory sulfurtransferase FdhD [Thermodesulfobacteriota bacterium]
MVREVPLTLLANGKELVTLQCTPDKLEYLAIGFLISEGLIKKDTVVERIDLNEQGWYVKVELSGDVSVDEELLRQRVISSGCAGGTSFYRVGDLRDCVPLTSTVRFSREKLFFLMKEFLNTSSLHKDTHGVHSCALCSQERLEIFSEDIGRHNAVDKIFGECFLKGIPTCNKAILTTGRVSSEILIKVAKQKVPLIVARSVPTDLAVDIAKRLNLTLVGFVRGSSMNSYCHDYRIV